MGRHLPEPRDAGVAERGTGVESAGNGMGGERLALLGQQSESPFFCCDQRIQPCRLAVEEIGDGLLLGEWWDKDIFGVDRVTIEPWDCCFVRSFIKS